MRKYKWDHMITDRILPIVIALLIAFIVSLAIAANVHAQTLTVSPTSGTATAPAKPTLTWDCGTGATSATSSGNWSGARAVNGTVTLGDLPAATHNFTLTCTYAPIPVSGSVLLTWIAGTQPPAIDGFNIYYGLTCSALTIKVGVANPTATTFTIPNLTAGTWCFGLKAYNIAGESVMSNTTTKTIAANPPTTKTVSVTWVVNPLPPPNPPTNLTVSEPTAYEIRTDSAGTLLVSRIGLVPVGTPCDSSHQQEKSGYTYTLVPREKVDMVNWPVKSNLQEVWARCGS